jgi:diaminopimelate epimerase
VSFEFWKGHGTENDFVLLPDPEGDVHRELAAELVRRLCDRRVGLGADGVLRVIRTEAVTDRSDRALAGSAEWFMDHRNADGSLTQMCGNGIRVFARYLVSSGLVPAAGPIRIGTRAGVKAVMLNDDDTLTVDMGRPAVVGETKVSVGSGSWPATNVDIGNPHAVAFVDSLHDAGALTEPPSFDVSTYPDGVNVEFVERVADRHVAMRVFERGAGETRSCGTGASAVLVAAALADGSDRPCTYRVDVRGGVLRLTWRSDGHVELTGPAVLVAVGTWLG